ncbi:DUF6221 family protein [Streptomyces sp. NPDC048331]|uniref:DUF6221 family protein n=1 Tax=Streptomyces sp. NPDC048331 TaxID=3365534 RepID=UPI0037206409
MDDLVQFLRARLDEGRANVQSAIDTSEPNVGDWELADLDSKRQIVDYVARELEDHGADNPWWYDDKLLPILRLLALPYADHPGYRPEWRPTD